MQDVGAMLGESAKVDMARSEDVRNLELWIQTKHYYEEREYKYNWLRFVPQASEEEKSLVMIKDNVNSDAYLAYVRVCQGAPASLDGYVFGFGCDPDGSDIVYSSEIYRLNTRDFNKGWEKLGVELQKAVSYPVAVVVDDKLYVFDFSRVKSELVFQVFDPCVGSITTLPPAETETERDCDDLVFLGYDSESKRIVFSSIKKCNLVFFYPGSNTWEYQSVVQTSVVQLGRIGYLTRGDKLYWVQEPFCLRSYHYKEDKFAYADLSVLPAFKAGFERRTFRSDFVDGIYGMSLELYHVSGNCYCLAWSSRRHVMDADCVCFTILRISDTIDGPKNDDPECTFKVEQLSTRKFRLPERVLGLTLWHIMPLYVSRATACSFKQPEDTIFLEELDPSQPYLPQPDSHQTG
jgi:hypothetical protein